MAIRFADRVALITGAGGGLGREYALEFARRGAAVVVNDLGGSRHGDGGDQKAADKVVDEILSLGGKAVANYDSVENGEKVVKTAIDNYGRLDIVVNNAGIIRDRSFTKMTEMDWDLVHKVHLKGSFMVTKAAWPYLRNQKFGRIIMTSSAAGLYGNFGQANYSAAKLGLLGLSNTLAKEGESSNILCNTVVPLATSRLTEDIFPPDMQEGLTPKFVAPLVVYLCHEACQENGGVFEVGAGWIGQSRWLRTDGAFLKQKTGQPMTVEQVRDHWSQITDFSHSHIPSGPQAATSQMLKFALATDDSSDGDLSSGGDSPSGDGDVPPTVSSGDSLPTVGSVDVWNTAYNKDKTDAGAASVNVEVARQAVIPPAQYTYTFKDIILYALSVGASTQHDGGLQYLYEGSDNFTVLPTFSVIPALKGIFGILDRISDLTGLDIDPSKVVHGEQYMEVYKPLATSGTLTSTVKIADILDKTTSASIILDVTTRDESGDAVAYNQTNVMVVGGGGFGGERSSPHTYPIMDSPTRSPDATITEATSPDQAALYRLCGDDNPLHIDPEFAALGGFPRPILHGLCSFGFAVRAVLRQYGNNDPNSIKNVKVRFSRPVYPGQTLQTNMWSEGDRVHFSTKVLETGEVCLSGGYVDLVGTVSQHIQQPISLQSDLVFDDFTKRLAQTPELVKKVNAVYLWNITLDGKTAMQWKMGVYLWNITLDGKTELQWTTDLKNGNGLIQRGEHGKADCSLTLNDNDLVAMATGKLNPQQAFMKGKLKLAGNIMLAQKLSQLFKDRSKL